MCIVVHHWVCIDIRGSLDWVRFSRRVHVWTFRDPPWFVFVLLYILSEMSGLFLGAPGHCPFHHYIRSWCDFTPYLIWVWSLLLLVLLVSLSFILVLFFIHHSHFTSYYFLIVTSFSGLILSSHHHYTSRHQFGFSSLHHHSYHAHSRHLQVHGSRDFLKMLHFIHEGMGFDHWVFGPSFPSFLSP